MTAEDVEDDGCYYVIWNGGAWLVKTASFFRASGGLDEPWGATWQIIVAESIEHARRRAAIKWGSKGELWP